MKRNIYTITISSLFLLIAALVVVRTVVSNSISVSGLTLETTQKKAQEIKDENLILREKILTLSSINHVASQAARLGFTKTESKALERTLPLAATQ